MAVELKRDGNRLVALLSGEIDHHSARQMRETIDRAVLSSRPSELELDFSGIGFMDSSGIGLVMGRYKLLTGQGGKLTVTGVSPRLRRVMQLSGLGRLGVLPKENTR